MLRDRLVCGINNEWIKQRLLAEAKLTYAKALELVKGLETAAQNIDTANPKEEPGNSTASVIHNVSTSANGKTTCYRCGITGHTSVGTSILSVASVGISREYVGVNPKGQVSHTHGREER